ncbi:MAG: hypothetical protein NVSMB30_25910 [Hymenobacter sp.]
MVFNLLSNALKYHHPDRSPEVRVRSHVEGEDYVLEVQDNGLGLDLTRERDLFGMFRRYHTHVEGTGIGLFMVKRMLENAGGRIAVHSQVGEGSTFTVYFPRYPRPFLSDSGAMTKLRCTLLVDDDLTTNFLNRKLLNKLELAEQVLVAHNGQEALQVLATECTEDSPTCPALIFLDVNMPLMDGFAFLAAYQQLPLARQRGIVIVMLTTSLHPRDLERLQALPVAGLLNKPLSAAKVQQVLQDHFA